MFNEAEIIARSHLSDAELRGRYADVGGCIGVGAGTKETFANASLS